MSGSVWRTFWDVSGVKGTTINFIDTPVIGTVSFLIPLYIFLFAIAGVLLLLIRRNRSQVKKYAFARALLLVFVTAAMSFALRMDYGWYKIWQTDRKSLSPGSLDERITFIQWPVYSFAQKLKKTMPSVKKVKIYTDDLYGDIVLKYYLLPVTISENANYIIIFSHKSIVFDTTRNALLENGNIVEKNVALLVAYDGKFFVFKKQDKDQKNGTE